MTSACSVCVLLDGSPAPKPVTYCPLCDAWLCDPCRSNWARRSRAMLKRLMEAPAVA